MMDKDEIEGRVKLMKIFHEHAPAFARMEAIMELREAIQPDGFDRAYLAAADGLSQEQHNIMGGVLLSSAFGLVPEDGVLLFLMLRAAGVAETLAYTKVLDAGKA